MRGFPGARARLMIGAALTAIALSLGANAQGAHRSVTPNASSGPAPGLCAMDTSRGSVPNDFAIAACIDSSAVWLRNSLQIPITISTTGSTGAPVKVSLDQGFAAVVTRLKYKTPYLLVPSDVMRIPFGAGAATITLADTRAGGTYVLAKTAAAFFPGGVPKAIYNAVTKLVAEIADVYAKRLDCESGKGVVGRAVCAATFVRDMAFAFARAAITGFGGAALKLFTGTVTWGKFVHSQVPQISGLISSHRTIKIAAAAATPIPPAVVSVTNMRVCPYSATTELGKDPYSGADVRACNADYGTSVGAANPIACSATIDGATGKTLTLALTDSSGSTLATPTETIAANGWNVFIYRTYGAAPPTGAYRCDISVAGVVVATRSFSVGGAPPPSSTIGVHIQDIFLGGTWARADPNDGTWYDHSHPPANGAYWYPNGLGVAVDCYRTAAAYVVKFADGHTETWNTWFHVTDGKWFPSAAAQEVSTNSSYGLPGC